MWIKIHFKKFSVYVNYSNEKNKSGKKVIYQAFYIFKWYVPQ